MFRCTLLTFLSIFVVCATCGKDFVSLGRHTWRSWKRVDNNGIGPNGAINMPLIDNGIEPPANSQVKCCCGRICKGIKGLKLHQRSCRLITGFDKEELFEEVADNFPDTNTGQDTLPEEIIDLKPGVRLQKTDEQWQLANQFFHSVLSKFTLRQYSIGEAIIHMNEIIFNYCKDTYGFQENNSNTGLVEKYQHHSLKNLKKGLKLLKDSQASLDEIRYVSRLLRSKLTKKTSTITCCETLDHDLSISKTTFYF